MKGSKGIHTKLKAMSTARLLLLKKTITLRTEFSQFLCQVVSPAKLRVILKDKRVILRRDIRNGSVTRAVTLLPVSKYGLHVAIPGVIQ
jgi:hypothetical protein